MFARDRSATAAQPDDDSGEGRRHVMAFVRQAVYARDGDACVECGQSESLVLDHVVPSTDGGSDTMSNLRVVCRTCRQPRR